MELNIRELEAGMYIKICNDPSYSITRHGGLEGYKEKIAGTIQKIQKVYSPSNRIYIVPPPRCGHEQISFNIRDIRRIEEEDFKVSFVEPVTFDPSQLDI